MATRSGRDMQEKLENLSITGVTETGEEIGRGAYATVVKLKYQGLKCAGKKLHGLYESGNECRKQLILNRFNEECQLLANLKHPHIVQFLGVHFENVSNAPILVMEYLQTTLSKCLDEHGSLPPEMCYSILKDVATALWYLHGNNPPIVHRDMSANNVLLTSNMTAKLADLGMAKILNLTPAQKHHMTTCPGTLAYMPPEALGHDPNYSTGIDCFSYGILMIHIFCGQWPIPDAQVQKDESGKRIILSEVERREKYLKTIECDHPIMNSLILQCLSEDDRPSAEQILQLIEEEASRFPPHFQNTLMMFRENQELRSQLEEETDQQDENNTVQTAEVIRNEGQNTLTQDELLQSVREEEEMKFRTRSESLLSEKLDLQEKLEEAKNFKSIKDDLFECDMRRLTSENILLKSKLHTTELQVQYQVKQQEILEETLKSKKKQLEIAAEMLATKKSQLLKTEEEVVVLKQANESSTTEIAAKNEELEAKDKEVMKMQEAFENISIQLNKLHEQNKAMQQRLECSKKELQLKLEELELMQEEKKQVLAEQAELKTEIACKNQTIELKEREIENVRTFEVASLKSELEVKEDSIQLLSRRHKQMQDYFADKKVSKSNCREREREFNNMLTVFVYMHLL